MMCNTFIRIKTLTCWRSCPWGSYRWCISTYRTTYSIPFVIFKTGICRNQAVKASDVWMSLTFRSTRAVPGIIAAALASRDGSVVVTDNFFPISTLLTSTSNATRIQATARTIPPASSPIIMILFVILKLAHCIVTIVNIIVIIMIMK